MFIILICSLFFARNISGYDSRYNSKKYFVLKNKEFAKILLPKSTGKIKRVKSDFNKMTYIGATFYICNALLVLSIPVFMLLIPEIQVPPFEIESRFYIFLADTLNEKLPVLLFLILLAVEIIFEFINVIVISKKQKQNQKGMIILTCILIVMIGLYGLLQIEELVSTIIEFF